MSAELRKGYLAAFALFVAPASACAASAPKAASKPAASLVAQAYCANVAEDARNVRLAWEIDQLKQIDAQAKASVAALDAKKAEVLAQIDRLLDMRRKATDDVVSIFAKMPAESAAAELVAMDETAAAAILARLNPRLASGILAEMDADKGARLSGLMMNGPSGKKS